LAVFTFGLLGLLISKQNNGENVEETTLLAIILILVA
jgi:hypothetical protein